VKSTCLEDEEENILLLEVILARATGIAPRKWTLMIPLSCVDAGVSRQMPARGKSLGTYVTHVLFPVRRRRSDLTRVRMMAEI
jgi:hypothetical protein